MTKKHVCPMYQVVNCVGAWCSHNKCSEQLYKSENTSIW